VSWEVSLRILEQFSIKFISKLFKFYSKIGAICDDLEREKFNGEWELKDSTNFKDLLNEMGVSWFWRTVGATAKPNVKISHVGNKYKFETISTFKTSVIEFELGEEFTEKTIDGRDVQSTFVFRKVGDDENTFTQTQKKDGKVILVVDRNIVDGKLIATAKSGSVTSVRTYEKV
jgi:fatty acid-binding protein 3, muscle and heart